MCSRFKPLFSIHSSQSGGAEGHSNPGSDRGNSNGDVSMNKVIYVTITAVALLRAMTANAADMPHRLPEPAPVGFSWNGFYFGGHTGVAVGKTTTSNVAPFGGFDSGVPLSYELNPVNVFGGGQFGYNWQYGVYVLGVEADVGYLGVRQTAYPAPDNYVAVKYGWYGTATGRLGLAYDRLLTYVKGGAAVASITNSAADLNGSVIDPSDFSETKK